LKSAIVVPFGNLSGAAMKSSRPVSSVAFVRQCITGEDELELSLLTAELFG
jgi:hypothetical protein